KGVQVGPPLELMALAGSMTAEVHCENVKVDRRWLLTGPTERVMAQGKSKGGAGGLETSCLALGLIGAALRYLQEESAARPDLRPSVERLQKEFVELRNEMYRLADGVAADVTAGASGGVAAGVAASFQLADPARQVENVPPRGADFPDP